MYMLSLTTLKRIIDQGSYSSAAASLFISQPSASNHIRQLERTFGAKLIEIEGRHPHLTDAGKVVYELATRIENEFGDAQRQIDDIFGRSKRLVTVVSNSSPLLHRLPSVIKCFWSEHPEVGIKTLKKSGYEITEAVKAGWRTKESRSRCIWIAPSKHCRYGVIRLSLFARKTTLWRI